MEDQLTVSTPEHIAFGYELAGVGSRFLAALVDTVIIVVLYVLIQVLMLTTNVLGDRVLNADTTGLSSFFMMLLTVMAFGVLWGYYVFFETLWVGQTPGKRLTGLRVLRGNGGPIGFWEALIRNLVRFLDFLPAAYGIGVVSMFLNGQARRLGDFAAGTVVVREGTAVTLAQLTARLAAGRALADPAAADPLALYMDLRRLTAADLTLLRELLARLPTLPPDRAWILAWQMTQQVVARTGFAGQVHDPYGFLAAVARALGSGAVV